MEKEIKEKILSLDSRINECFVTVDNDGINVRINLRGVLTYNDNDRKRTNIKQSFFSENFDKLIYEIKSFVKLY